MFPGVNPRQMRQVMKRMGMQQEELDVLEVVFRLRDKELVIANPSVSKINMMGQDSFQVSGDVEERSLDSSPEIVEDDIQTVIEQTGCSEEDAKKVLDECNGDLAEAIMKLQS